VCVCVCPSPADLDTKGKVLRVLKSIVKFVLLVGLLYVFVCSLDILSSAFQLVGGNGKLFFFELYNFCFCFVFCSFKIS